MYVVGASGTGKTTLTRLIAKGLEEASREYRSAFIYLEPKGDDSFKFLAQVDSLDADRVTFLDPVLTKFSVNPLELPNYTSQEERLVSVYTGFLMQVIQEWYGAEPSRTPSMLRIIRSFISYLYHKHDAPTLVDFYDLVVRMQKGVDPTLLKDIEETLGSEEAELMKKEMTAITEMREESFDPVLTRLAEFATDPFLRRIFSISRSTEDFAELLEPGHGGRIA